MSFQILQRAYAPYGTAAQFPASGDSRLIYRATDTGYLYTWDASESAYKLAGIDPATAPYLGLHAQADDAARLGGQLPSYYAQASHVHTFAGSSTPGGAATTALACTGNAATATTAASCTGNSATATTASSCSGNAATATALATPRTLTIGSKANTFDGSADKAWTLAEIGAASTVSYNDIRAVLYSGQCGNSSCRIPVASTGDGTGVLTIRLFSSTSNTAKLSAGYFCSDAGGGTNLGMSMTMQSGQYSEIFVKLTSGSGEIVIENGWALTEWGKINTPCITETTNGPKLNGFDVGFIPANSTGINLYANAGLSSVVGTPRPWQNAGVVQLLGSGFSVNGPVHPMTSSAYTLLVGNSMVLTANLFECCRTMEQQFIYIDGAQVAVSYPASRRWPSVMRGMFIRPATGTFPSSDVDRLFNDLAQWCTAITFESIFDLRGNCGAATANSYAARSYLAGLGAAVYVNI